MSGQTIKALGYEWTIQPENFITKRARILLDIRFSKWVEETERGELEKEALTSLSHLYYDTLSVTKKLVHPKKGDCQALLNTWAKHPELWLEFVSGQENDDELYALESAVQALNPHWYPQLAEEEAAEVAEQVEEAVKGQGDAMGAAKVVAELQDKREEEAEKNG